MLAPCTGSPLTIKRERVWEPVASTDTPACEATRVACIVAFQERLVADGEEVRSK